jgi:hypothetical protein
MIAEKVKKPAWNPEFIRDISVRVYCHELGLDDTKRMLERDADGGVKLRARAGFYDNLSRVYLDLLGFKPPAE